MEAKTRAFTVKPFWALLIMADIKDVENRTFRAPPGRYLVHASRSYSWAEHRECHALVAERFGVVSWMPTWEECAGIAGKIVGGVEVSAAVTRSLSPWWDGERVAWELREPRRIVPVEAVGRLGLWKVDDWTMEQVRTARAEWLRGAAGRV